VIDMYRQCAVRWQKAHDWERSRNWAERGITIYGDDAARPEVVDDLRYEGSSRKAIDAFKAVLDRAGLPATVRLTRGRDIAAACGQLAAIRSA
jgi:hypothetical protein